METYPLKENLTPSSETSTEGKKEEEKVQPFVYERDPLTTEQNDLDKELTERLEKIHKDMEDLTPEQRQKLQKHLLVEFAKQEGNYPMLPQDEKKKAIQEELKRRQRLKETPL